MTDGAAKGNAATRWVLAAAVLIAGAAIGVALNRDPAEQAPAAAVTDPLDALRRTADAAPNNAVGWQALGDALFVQGEFGQAVAAFERTTRAAPGTARGWSSLGEARVMASARDPMPAAALEAFQRAHGLDPKDPRARYFLAVQRDLTGDHRGAVADWLALLADTPARAPWENDLRRTIEQVGKINAIDVTAQLAAVRQVPGTAPLAARAIPGPSAADLQAASAIPPSQQRTMAEGMVAKLEARLGREPADVAGWTMLMRSRMTLGQPDKAAAALRQALTANPAQTVELRQQAAVLGVR